MDRPRPALSSRAGRAGLLAIPLAFLALFFVFPLVSILDRGLRPDGALDLGAIGRVIGDPDLRGVAWFTLWQATVSTVLTLLVGLPAAFVLSRFAFRGRRVVRAMTLVPFVLPTVVVGTAFVGLLGPGSPGATAAGWLGIDAGDGLHRTIGALLAAHVFFNVAVVVRVVGSYWDQVDPELEETAESLGAGRIETFRRVLLPIARPAIASAAALVFLFAFTSFGIVLLLGRPGASTLEVEVYRHTSQLLDLSTAAVLALVQMVFVGALLLVESVLAARAGVPLSLITTGAARPIRDRRERLLVVSVVVATCVLLVTPVLALVWRAFGGGLGGLSLRAFTTLGDARRGSVLSVAPLSSIGHSLVTASAAAVFAVVIGVPAALAIARARRSSWLTVLVALPLGVSAVTVGFGYVVAFDDAPLDLRGSAWVVPLAQAVIALPFVVRIVTPVLVSIESGLTEAAADLGASPGRILTAVTLPIARPAIAAAGAFAFIVALGEFGAAAFLATPDRPTLPVAISRLLGQPGSASLSQAAAMSVILMVVTAVGALAIDRFGRGTSGAQATTGRHDLRLLAWNRAHLVAHPHGDPDRRVDLADRHRFDPLVLARPHEGRGARRTRGRRGSRRLPGVWRVRDGVQGVAAGRTPGAPALR